MDLLKLKKTTVKGAEMAGTPRIQHVCVTTADCLESAVFAGSIHYSPYTGRDKRIAITGSPAPAQQP